MTGRDIDRSTDEAAEMAADQATDVGTTSDSGTTSGTGSRGFEAVLIILYALFATAATARSVVQMLRDFSFAPVAYLLSLAAALTYIAVSIALVKGGRRSRPALVLCLIELVGVLGVGTLSLLDPALFPDASVWSVFGQGYGYVPLLLPVIALVYLLRGRHRAPRTADDAR
ncbi:hypothetical protein [Brachybacterium tyrofermentans]|uniref:hypothetical protein n=1 Tax=Brachybacterium tyrofermentans TaxID=47848 RepID=UPI003F92EF24